MCRLPINRTNQHQTDQLLEVEGAVMDDETKQLLREIRNLQKEQLELLRPWLRHQFRFSLRALLIALTMVAVFLGVIAFLNTSQRAANRPAAVTKK
jgi:hypothetical protein